MDDTAAIKALAALAQPCRLRVFRSLVGAGEAGLTPHALSEALDVPSSTLSFHLKELALTGWVSSQRVGRQLIYRADLARMGQLTAYLTSHCSYARCCGNDAVLSTGFGTAREFA